MSEIEHFPNIQRYREAKGISIKEMTTKSGISVAQYKNIESGNSEPDPDELETIAEVLEIPEYKLVNSVHELQNVRFRSNGRQSNRKLVILEVEYWLNEYNLVEELLEDSIPNPLQVIGSQIREKKKTISEVAKLTRDVFGLNRVEP